MKISSNFIILAAFIPAIGLVIAIKLDQLRRKKIEKPPQAEKLLRPPGYSLSLKLDETVDALMFTIFVACAMAVLAAVFVLTLQLPGLTHGLDQKSEPGHQRQTIFRLLLQKFGAMIGNTTKGTHPRAAALWCVTVESWLRCQGLIAVRQNQSQKVSPTFPKIWSQN